MKFKLERGQFLWEVTNTANHEGSTLQISDIQQDDSITPCALFARVFDQSKREPKLDNQGQLRVLN